MKYKLILYGLCLWSFSCASQNLKKSLENPFDTLHYKRVKVYRNLLPVVSVKPPKQNLKGGKALTVRQIKSLISIVGDTATYGTGRIGIRTALESYDFIFFNKADDVVGQIGIRYESNYLLSDPSVPATTYYKFPFGTDTLNLFGFSDSGRYKVRKLLNDLGMDAK